jgi:hypothetical protein
LALSSWQNNPKARVRTPELYAKRGQSAEVYANLGWLGMHPSEVYANLGSPGEGVLIAGIAVIARGRRDRKNKTYDGVQRHGVQARDRTQGH